MLNNFLKKIPGLLAIFMMLFVGCTQHSKETDTGKRAILSFAPVQGVAYSEVSRLTANGLSFNDYGFQLEPQWRLNFVSADSVSMYSPIKNAFINLPLTCGYDSIFNIARTWLKMRKMNKDSLVLELLKSTTDSIDVTGTKVFMTFYADKYIAARHTTLEVLRHPHANDTIYIKALAATANKDLTKAFCARQPVVLTSRSSLVKVTQRKTEATILNNFDESTDYMSPVFDIAINKAYADFYYSFSILVDDKGNMHYGKPLVPFTDSGYRDDFIRLSTAIMNGYLKLYLSIKPGSTLGIPHTSEISVHVEGKRGK